MRRVLILFPDEWDLLAAGHPRNAGRYSFSFAGFDLFRFPGNLRLFTFDALRFIDETVRRHRGAIDAVVTSDEQFGPYLAAPIAAGLGVPHAQLEAVLAIQHKFYARRAIERIAPAANARFGLMRADSREPPLP